ncbi:hypothetical protein [Roseobacter sp. TSBP12]|uniref:hypothetical protein n=1 Tax=Roseobacter sp. TSBP12 TaxID=1236613 RepID=UPI00125F9349|nr:hypothetical protein [Roseobacter sp. TSBP12]KAB6714305.1 hypothetical protein C8029_21435 [Roseobacter sp. TSBP12]
MSELPAFARFYMVCRKPSGPMSKTEPRQRYSHLSDAREAAHKLASQNDAPFLILESVEIIRPGDATEGRLL